VEVYYLRRLTLIEKMRGELRLPKSARERHKGIDEYRGGVVQEGY
jgi:hypothetical protein